MSGPESEPAGGPVGAVDLGGTNVKAAIADAAGAVLAERSVPTDAHAGPDVVLARIAALLRELAAEAGAGELSAVGVGVPGLVDARAGVTKFLPNLPTRWRDVPAAAMLGGELGCPVRLLNDARAATLAELRFGRGAGRPDITFAFFTLGTGVGGGVVVDGQLRLGPLGAAGELGHQTVVPNGPRCGCGNRGCLETVASGPAIAAEGVRLMRAGLAPALHGLTDGDAGRVTAETMAAAADADEPVAEAIETAAEALGLAAANVVTILHPELIVLGGGVAALGDRLTGVVRRTITARVGMFPAGDVRVERSTLGERAGVLGAAALALTT